MNISEVIFHIKLIHSHLSWGSKQTVSEKCFEQKFLIFRRDIKIYKKVPRSLLKNWHPVWTGHFRWEPEAENVSIGSGTVHLLPRDFAFYIWLHIIDFRRGGWVVWDTLYIEFVFDFKWERKFDLLKALSALRNTFSSEYLLFALDFYFISVRATFALKIKEKNIYVLIDDKNIKICRSLCSKQFCISKFFSHLV